jgi:hypothetical protein
MKLRDFLPILLIAIAFVVFMAAPTFAQEEETITEEEVIQEAAPADTVVQEEVVPVEEEAVPVEEEVAPVEEEVAPVEEEVIEEQPAPVEEEAPAEEVVKEEPSMFKPGWTAKVYINGGVIEPWGDPGTGALFNTGMRIQGGAQLNIGNWVKLPLILQPLTAEVMVGYGMWNIKPDYTGVYVDGKTNVISILALGRYDVTDLIMKAIGFEYPSLGIFGVAGFQYNMQSWDFPNWTREFDTASSFGLNLGVGVKYNLQSMVGKPVEVDLRFTQGVFIMGDVKDQNGDPFYSDADYQHTENGILLGIAYPF